MTHSTLLEQPFHPPNLMFDSPAAFQVEDFFNLDLLSGNDDSANSNSSAATTGAAQSTTASSSSRASSEARTDSPAGSFTNLQTPPQAEALPSFDVGGLSMGMDMNFDSASFGGLPPIEEESMFTSSSGFFKPGTDPLAGLSHSPFDLFASLDSGLGGATSSAPASSGANSSPSSSINNNNSSFPFSAIDPQLVRTPVTSASTDSTSDVGAEPDSDEDEPRGLVIAPVKVGGKGKARRGTLHSGGVSKKPALPGPQSIFGSLSTTDGPSASVGKGSGKGAGKSKEGGKFSSKERISKDKDQDIDDEKDEDADDWRPSPEEYARMSSKEKRQLRNKISARNFRIRRKEYIHTLEGDIADRDRLIDAIRSELGNTKSENHALRQEVAALKKAILEGRASPMLPPPAPLSPLSPFSSFTTLPSSSSSSSNATASGSNTSNNIIKPNTHKDLPTSPRLGASPFWGGHSGGFGSLGGGITPVHTAIIPETTASVFNTSAERQKENINPALNVQSHQQLQQQQAFSQVLSQLYGNSGSNSANTNVNSNNMQGVQNPFDSFGFADVNPFTLKTLDAYRMQLWNRVAAQAQYAQRSRSTYSPNGTGYPSPPHSSPEHSPKTQSLPQASAGLSGLASSLRPLSFAPTNTITSSTSPTTGSSKPFSSLLSGKGLPYAHNVHHGLPTPPASPSIRPTNRQQQQQQKEREQAQTHALLATLASQTVLHRLGSAFWDAFSGSSSAPHNLAASPVRAWDTEKVCRVLEGSAVLRVVDVDRPSSSSATSSASADALAENMRNLSLRSKQEKREDIQGSERKGFFTRMNCGSCSKKSSCTD